MYSNRPFFGSRKRSRFINRTLKPALDYILLLVLFLGLLRTIFVLGFTENPDINDFRLYKEYIAIILLFYIFRVFIGLGFKSFTRDFSVYILISLFLLATFLITGKDIRWLNNQYYYALVILVLFIFELSRFDISKITLALNPAQLFMLSFTFLIVTGAALLSLPNATTSPLTIVDALFTSTSAVCITGLVVVDTATHFTTLGKGIILLLMQIGGIGILTFSSFFGFFFKGGTTSFSQRFVLSDFLSDDNISEIRKTLAKVIFIMFLFEAIGALFIFFSLDHLHFPEIGSRIKFSVFHSIAAFCNAGFSTLSDGIQDHRLSGNYPLLYILSFLVIFGAIGFPILLNLYTYVKFKLTGLVSVIMRKKKKMVKPMLISVNSRLVIYTSLFLIAGGTLFFFIFEKNNTMAGMDLSGKIAHSFFNSVAPRSGGYSSLNIPGLSIPAIFLFIFLMWIGGSPVSTAGGIKTSTFAIAMMNVLRIARMKNHIEFNRREIHEASVDRAFAIISFSIVILGCSSLIMYLLEPEIGVLKIVFECVSAFGTVGLSLGITPHVTDVSKLLLIILMFIGRMGILTLLFAVVTRSKSTTVYRYPKEKILIT